MDVVAVYTQEDDSSALVDRLQAWLRRRPGYGQAVIDHLGQAASGTGTSNETYKALITPRPGGRQETYILRLPPNRESLLQTYDMALQFSTMKALEGIPNLPVVRGKWLEEDPAALGRPFYLMEFVEGLIASDEPIYVTSGWVVDATDEQRSRMWTSSVEAIGRLAGVDWRARGLQAYEWPDRNRSAIEQNLERWIGIYEWGAASFPAPEIPPIVKEMQRWLQLNLPKETSVSLNWGDARFANMIFRDFEPVALIDWETAMVGDSEIDIMFFLLLHRHKQLLARQRGAVLRELRGFLSDEETIAHYERFRGVQLRNANYYWLFNAYRIYGIRQRMACLQLGWNMIDLDTAETIRTVPTLHDDIARRMDLSPSSI
jgi:aminoglycoside phosphotransferase (APT) family kinase protein